MVPTFLLLLSASVAIIKLTVKLLMGRTQTSSVRFCFKQLVVKLREKKFREAGSRPPPAGNPRSALLQIQVLPMDLDRVPSGGTKTE
jgi:hypothetical protein